MPRGQYAVQPGVDVEASKQTARDNSYRACLHAMLIFIAICIILLACAWPWNNHRADRKNQDSNTSDPSAAAARGENTSTTGTYEEFETTHEPTTSTARTGSTSRPTRYPTRTTTEAIERKPLYTVIPVVEPDETTTSRPISSTTSRPTRYPTSRPTSSTTSRPTTTTTTTTEAIERKLLYTVISEEEPDEATTPTEGTTAEGEATTLPEEPVPEDSSDRPEQDRRLPYTEGGTERPEDVTRGTTAAEEETNTLLGDVEVLTWINRQSETQSQANYESSSTDVFNEEVLTTNTEPSSPASLADNGRLTDTTPLSPVTEVSSVSATSDTSVKNCRVDSVCESSQCKELATRMLTLMNHTVDPCDDFYEFACGGLRFNPTLLGDDPSRDVYDRIRRAMDLIVDGSSSQAHMKFKKYYKSCMEFDSVSKDLRLIEVRRVLETVGSIIETAETSPVVDTFTSLISKLMLYHSTPLFDVILDVDVHNPSVFALKLTAPTFKPIFRPGSKRDDCLKSSLIGDLNTYYNEYVRCKKEEHTTYLQELDDALEVLNVQRKTITAILHNMEGNLLSAMEDLPPAGVMQKQLTGKEYDLMTINELNTLYPQVDWMTLVATLLKRTVSADTHVQVYFKGYLTKMFALFHELQPRQQHNVLVAWFAHDLYVDLILTRESCSRDSYCLRVASDLMEDVSSSLYLSTFRQAKLRGMRAEAQQVFKQLRNTLETELRHAKWLDDPSRSAAVSKLKALTLEADGGEGLFLDKAFIDQRMDQIQLQETNYVTLSTSLLQRYRQLMYALYNVKPNDPKAMWSHFLLPYSTQGIVIYALKKVVIPYGLMQKPMYEPGLPRYLLMARLGFVIAHEMAHHFDTTGMLYGPNGKGDDILSMQSRPTFNEMMTCPKDLNSYQGYHTADDGRDIKFKANESLSLNERLADRTAALLSYETYQASVRGVQPPQLPYLGLTNDQVYFLAMAQIFCSKSTILDYGVSLFEDEHPPPFLRVNTLVDNSRKFPDVFECKLGVKMNPSPDLKCEAFPQLTQMEAEQDYTPVN